MVYGGALANRISYICYIHKINTAASTGMHVVPTLGFPSCATADAHNKDPMAVATSAP